MEHLSKKGKKKIYIEVLKNKYDMFGMLGNIWSFVFHVCRAVLEGCEGWEPVRWDLSLQFRGEGGPRTSEWGTFLKFLWVRGRHGCTTSIFRLFVCLFVLAFLFCFFPSQDLKICKSLQRFLSLCLLIFLSSGYVHSKLYMLVF